MRQLVDGCCLVPPRIAVDGPVSRISSVIVGESAELWCNATGTPSPRVTWQKGTSSLNGTYAYISAMPVVYQKI